MRTVDRDSEDLGRFGYAQQLRRTLGGFSSFAVAFSLISVFTGIFANFGHGLRQVGGAVAWSWLVVLAGQLLVAWVMADLARRIPLSGYGYQWSSRLVNPHFGFGVGWLLLLQFLTGFPGICATLAAQIHAAFGIGADGSPPLAATTIGVLTLVTLTQLWGLRAAARVNDLGVWTELVGVAGVGLVLLAVALRTGHLPDSLLQTREARTGLAAGPGAWALSLLLGAWCLTGFEAAADLAEETVDPRRTVPRAMMASLIGSGLGGFALLVGAVGCIRDLAAVQSADNPLVEILRQTVGPALPGVLAIVGISIFACALAAMATTSRLLFALGRDRMLPGSEWLSRIAPGGRAPRNAIVLIWALSCALVLGLPTLDIVTQISAVAGYLGYGGIMGAALWRASQPTAGSEPEERRALTRIIAAMALLWSLGVVGALTLTPTPVAGIRTLYLPAFSTAFGLLLGAGIYLTTLRGRLLRGEAGPPRSPAPPTNP